MMNVGLECNIEMVSLPSGTPRQIATAYEIVANSAYAATDIRFSSATNAVLRYGPTCIRLQEIDGSWFAEIERGFFNDLEKAEESEL